MIPKIHLQASKASDQNFLFGSDAWHYFILGVYGRMATEQIFALHIHTGNTIRW